MGDHIILFLFRCLSSIHRIPNRRDAETEEIETVADKEGGEELSEETSRPGGRQGPILMAAPWLGRRQHQD